MLQLLEYNPSVKKIISAIIIFLIVATASVYFFDFLDKEPVEIVSDDQRFTLSLSSESLPDGVSFEDVSIEKLEESEFSEFEKALEPFAVYRLGPEGTQFAESVTFEVTVETPDNEYTPSLLHIAEGSVETVSDVHVEKNEDGTFTMQGTIDHFSDFVIRYGFFASDMPSDLGTHLVGEPFTVTATMKMRKVDSVSPGLEAVLEGDPEFTTAGEFFANSIILTPIEITDQPPKGTLFTSSTMTAEGTFTCLDTGYAEIRYISGVFYDYNFYRDGIAGLSDIFNYIFPAFLYDGHTFVEKATVRCVEPDPEDLEALLSYEVSTECGTAETNGRLQISGTLLHPNVKGVKVRIGDKTYTPALDSTTGAFEIDESLHPGTYGFEVTAITTLDHEIMVQRYGVVEVPWCPEEEDAPETEDPIFFTDPVSEEEESEDKDDEVEVGSDGYGLCVVPENDACSNPAQYGFPVCDATNLPADCRPTDDRPGWDCYTFEDAACEPSTRCFCIAPAEYL